MQLVDTDNAPAPRGHYAQGVTHDGFLFVSAQLPIDPITGKQEKGSIDKQTLQVLKNILAIVEAAGGDKSTVVKITVYVTDISLWAKVNAVYAEFFGDFRPARAVVPVKDLHHGVLLEMEAIAVIPANKET